MRRTSLRLAAAQSGSSEEESECVSDPIVVVTPLEGSSPLSERYQALQARESGVATPTSTLPSSWLSTLEQLIAATGGKRAEAASALAATLAEAGLDSPEACRNLTTAEVSQVLIADEALAHLAGVIHARVLADAISGNSHWPSSECSRSFISTKY